MTCPHGRTRPEGCPHCIGINSPGIGSTPPTLLTGYERPIDRHWRLVSALSAAMMAHPNERVGQILVNSTAIQGVFNIWDEDMITCLETYAERKP